MNQEVVYHRNLEQGTQDWLNLRAGRVGGTGCSALLTNGRSENGLGAGAMTLIYALVGERIAGVDPGYVSEAMQRGTDLEPLARKRYESEKFCTVEQIGYISKGDYMGVSPDGVIQGEKAGIEIKCPSATEYIRFADTREIPKQYLAQCNWPMYIAGFEWVDFVMYHPDFKKDIQVERVFPDQKMFEIWNQKVPIVETEIKRLITLLT